MIQIGSNEENICAVLDPYIEGRLEEPEISELEAHMESCEDCREELALWNRIAGIECQKNWIFRHTV